MIDCVMARHGVEEWRLMILPGRWAKEATDKRVRSQCVVANQLCPSGSRARFFPRVTCSRTMLVLVLVLSPRTIPSTAIAYLIHSAGQNAQNAHDPILPQLSPVSRVLLLHARRPDVAMAVLVLNAEPSS
jgi:hypothetical protein